MLKRTYVYPGSDLDRGQALIATLGTFWSRIYAAKDQMQSYTGSTATLAAQNYQNLLETVSALSRFDVPIFHKQFWVPIRIRRSDLTPARVVNNFFDVGAYKFDMPSTQFDGVVDKNLFYFAAPDRLNSVGQIFNRIIHPTVALIENVDYVVDTKSGTIAFVSNPFENPGFTKKLVAAGDKGASDEEIILWGFRGLFDYEYVFNQFAYALGMRLASSQGFKDLMNAVFDGLISGGATCADLDLAISAICGIPLTVEPEETVEVVDNDTHGLFVATDKNLYRFGDFAEAIVKPGQVVRAGSQLIRGFEIDEFFVGHTYDPLLRDGNSTCCPVPASVLATNAAQDLLTESDDELFLNAAAENCTPRKALSALALDRGFLSACFYGDLVFENKEVPLIVDTADPSGYTYVSFKVAGMPNDVKQFFDEIHDRGVTAARAAQPCPDDQPRRYTLAHFLDRRKTPISEPGPEHLPTTINPLRFIVENTLRNNVFVVKLTVSALGRNRLGLYNIRHLRQLLPPGTVMILVFDLEAPLNKIKGPDKVKENTQFFVGAEPATNTINDTFINDLGATARLISGSCQ